MDKALKDLSGKFSDLLAQHQELSDDFESYKETSVQKHDALRAELDELRERVLALKSKDEAVPPTVPFFDKLKLDYPPGPDPTGVAHADKQRYKLNYPDGMLKLAGGAPDIAALYKLQLALIDYCSREGRVPYNWQVDVFDALYRRALIDAKDAMNVLTAPHDGVTWLKYLADYIDLMGPPLENALKPVKHLIISENNTLSLAVLQTALTTLLNNIADAANASSLNTRSRRDARKLTVAALAYRLPPAVRSRLYTELGMAPADDPSKTLTYSELRSFAQAALRSAWDEAGINATQRDIFAPRDGEGKAIKPKASASAKEDAEAAPAAKSTTAPAAKYLSEAWTGEHTAEMKSAIDNICCGDWLLVYDPNQPVYVSTDAASLHGFSVAACQYDVKTGALRPIANFSQGWLGSQLRGWTAQVKECYALRYAVTKMMPAAFPYAQVITLCDNRNLAGSHDSEDLRILRWQQEISDAGAITRQWVPGEYNTIADHGSRAVQSNPLASPDAGEAYHSYIYSITISSEKGEIASESNTVVPGHLPIAAMTASIAAAQHSAAETEQARWASMAHYSTATLAGRTLHLIERRLIVPAAALGIKSKLLHLAHDDQCHYTGVSRTLHNLRDQAKVWWENMDTDTASYIKSCYRCAFARARHSPSTTVGQLVPTIPPYVMHTVYVDLKGPMPEGTGYLLGAVEGLTKDTRLRFLPQGTAKEVNEELAEVFASFGSNPVVLRSDGGPPFNSAEYTDWCASEGIMPITGVADHSQGQGTVETKFRGIAQSLIALLGGKAPTGWYKDPTVLAKLERVINNTYSSTLGGCPTWARTGLTPRTPLSTVNFDFTSTDYGATLVGMPGVEENDLQEVIAQHHDNIDRVHGRVSLAVSLSQALTKSRWDATRKIGDFKVNDWVLVYFGAPNRLMPHFRGPYKVNRVTDDSNFVYVTHYLTEEGATFGPYHVSRLLRFDFGRATASEIAAFELTEGSDLVTNVTAHRQLNDGSYEFQVEWASDPTPSWLGGFVLRRVTKVIDYCKLHSLPSPGSGVRRASSVPTRSSSRGRGRGRGRGH